jgi:hypothetical protein
MYEASSGKQVPVHIYHFQLVPCNNEHVRRPQETHAEHIAGLHPPVNDHVIRCL